jgi:uncharacterized protein (DUF427 family)
MSLTVGTGPFGPSPSGSFNFEVAPPTGAVLFWDPVPQRIRATFAGETVVDSTRAKLLHETRHLPVYYLPPEDVRLDLLEQSSTLTRCAYKGVASHFAALGHEDVAWTYPDPQHDAEPVRDRIAFYDERVDVEVGGERSERPVTQWSR